MTLSRNRAWIVTVPLVVLLGLASAMLAGSGTANPWFDGLAKPWFMPPGWAFPLVWITLYVLMGLALGDVIAARAPHRRTAIGCFVAQLALNLSWSPVFFAGHRIDLGLAIILLLDLAAIGTIAAFWRVRRRAAILLLPYPVWLAIATALNWAILRLNG